MDQDVLPTYRADIADGLAAAAPLVTTLAASGGFGRKWQANRRSRGRIVIKRNIRGRKIKNVPGGTQG